MRAGVSDRVANVSGFSDRTLDDHYGASEQNPDSGDGKKKSSYSSSAGTSAAPNIVQQSIIKRFNQHSIMVMRATEQQQQQKGEDKPQDASAAAATVANGAPADKKPEEAKTSTSTGPGSEDSRKRLREKLTYDDLMEGEGSGADSSGAGPALKLAKVERYLSGPTSTSASAAASSSAASSAPLSYQELSHCRQLVRREVLDGWRHGARPPSEALPTSAAVGALIDLSPGGALMQASRQEALLAEQCPDKVQKDLRALYVSLAELGRHFWSCFPPTTPQLQEKAAKMHETLRKFQQVKLRPFENELARNYTAMSSQLTNHINQVGSSSFSKQEHTLFKDLRH